MNAENNFTMQTQHIKGARKIGPKNQYITSSGFGSLDAILGGGVPAGSLLLIEEDEFGIFSKVMLKHFLSEGIVNDHSLLVATKSTDPKKLVLRLPALLENNLTVNTNNKSKLNIAWRYENMPKFNSLPDNIPPFTNQYDLSKHLGKNKVLRADIHYWDNKQKDYDTLLKYIYEVIQNGQFGSNIMENDYNIQQQNNPFQLKKQRNILRIVLHSIGSALWEGNVVSFLQKLRAVIRKTYSVCLITIPTHFFKDSYIIHRCEHMCDTVIKVMSLANKGNPAYGDYDGLLYLNKLPSVNALHCYVPETVNWGFKLQKRQFLIEKLHIAPDLGESVNREGDDVSKDYLPT